MLVSEKLMVKGHSEASRIQKDWEEQRDNIKTAGGFLPTVGDAKALTILAYDMKRGGNLWSKFRIQNYAGSSYIIFKGNHRLRHHLTGTRYLANNPKVVSMGLGQTGANKAIRGGGIVTVIFSVFFHGMDQLMNDELTWHHFVGGLAADVVVAAAAAGVSWFAVGIGAAMGAAIGPLAAVLVVGTIAGIGLSFLFSEKLAKLFADGLRSIEEYLKIKPPSAGQVILLASNFGKVAIENALAQLTLDIKQAKTKLQQNLRYAQKDPQGFLNHLFNVPDTRKVFK